MNKSDLLKKEIDGLEQELIHPEGKPIPKYGTHLFLKAVLVVRKRELIAQNLRFNNLNNPKNV